MIVVFDTNIWLQSLVLRSGSGAAVRFFLNQSEARLALPEVVRLEVERNLRNNLRKFVDNISRDHRQLLAVFGKLKEVVLPTDEEIEQRIAQVFVGLGVELVDVPFTLESARSSFIKTVDKIPPSDGTQQFKDGVLWHDCLALLKEDDVVLVTADKAFYKDHDYKKGLATPLAEEASEAPRKLTIYPRLGDLLAEFRHEVSIDEAMLESAVFAERRDSVDRILTRGGFLLGPRLRVERTQYITEDPDCLFLEFSIVYECPHISDTERQPAVLTVRGDGMYHLPTRELEQAASLGEVLRFKLEDGSEEKLENYVLRAGNLVLGHREVTHTVRHILESNKPPDPAFSSVRPDAAAE